jgi:hypothetical protein
MKKELRNHLTDNYTKEALADLIVDTYIKCMQSPIMRATVRIISIEYTG